MSKLFIANPKAQAETFAYRVPDNDMPGQRDPNRTSSGVRTQHIPPGGCLPLSGDLTTAQIDAIVDQHEPYGLYWVADISKRQTSFVNLIATVDKPVSADVLESVMRANLGLLSDKGRKMRELAAVSVNNKIENDMTEARMPGELTSLEMEVVEQRTASSEAPETVPQRVRVTRDTEDAPPPQKRAYNRRKAA